MKNVDPMDWNMHRRNYPSPPMTDEQRAKCLLLDIYIGTQKWTGMEGNLIVAKYHTHAPLYLLYRKGDLYCYLFKTVDEAIAAVLDTENYIWG